jgi:hypothetical protein
MSRVCVANMYSLTWSVLCVEYNIVSRVLCTVALGGGGGGDDVMSAVSHCRPARLPRGIVKPVLFVNSTQCCVVERK